MATIPLAAQRAVLHHLLYDAFHHLGVVSVGEDHIPPMSQGEAARRDLEFAGGEDTVRPVGANDGGTPPRAVAAAWDAQPQTVFGVGVSRRIEEVTQVRIGPCVTEEEPELLAAQKRTSRDRCRPFRTVRSLPDSPRRPASGGRFAPSVRSIGGAQRTLPSTTAMSLTESPQPNNGGRLTRAHCLCGGRRSRGDPWAVDALQVGPRARATAST